MKKNYFIFISIFSLLGLSSCKEIKTEKPAIYLYPEHEVQIEIQIDLDGELGTTYPKYNNGWKVTARPDGSLTDQSGYEYDYLFWDGYIEAEYELDEGFVVEGKNTAVFLRETLVKLGLEPREYNEFIIYWLPRMENNPYNLITFQDHAYTEHARLAVNPKPDTVIRIFMVWKSLNQPVDIVEPELKLSERQGFTLVEWGGLEIK